MPVKLDNVRPDFAAVGIDQQPVSDAIDGLVITGKVDFTHQFDRETVDIGNGSRRWFTAETMTLFTSSNSPHPVRLAMAVRKSTSSMVLSENST